MLVLRVRGRWFVPFISSGPSISSGRAGRAPGAARQYRAAAFVRTTPVERVPRMQCYGWFYLNGHGPGIRRGAKRRLVICLAGRGHRELTRLTQSASMLAVSCSVSGRFPRDGFTDLVGRRDELARLAAVLAESRLVTIVGPGGVGKTRVALAAAAQAATRHRAGPGVVRLSRLGDAALLPNTVASLLGLPEQDARSALAALLEYLRERELLLILDTCEHVLDACAALAQAVLQEAPGVTVLATSRQALDMAGEHTFPVGPLPVPETCSPAVSVAGLVDGGDAVELFALRAAAAAPGFAVTTENVADVIRLCRRLDGIPLAIELAAMPLRTLPLAELVARLDHRFALLSTGRPGALPRHKTLRTAIEWSYELCSAAERRLWGGLAGFA